MRKEKMKKIIAVLLVLMLQISVMSMGAYAENDDQLANIVLDDGAEENLEEVEACSKDEDSNATEANGEDTEEDFDQLLVGAWELYSSQEPERINERVRFFSDFRFLEAFMCNGAINSYLLDYPVLIAEVGEALVINTVAGEMDYYDQICEFTERYPGFFGEEKVQEYVKQLESCSNVKITYKLFDITSAGIGDFKPSGKEKAYYKENMNDGLSIRIEADVQISPLERKHQVYEYKFYKEFGASYSANMKWNLLGRWEDSMGNTWDVAPYIAEDNGSTMIFPDHVCILKDASGKEYVTKEIYWPYEQNGIHSANGFLNIYFKDFEVPSFKVESVDHEELVLSSESGELILTRTAEPYSTADMSMPQ